MLPRLQGDDKLRRFWHHRADDNVHREKQLFIDFPIAAADGPAYYTGRDIKTAYKGMRIDKEEWQRPVGHLRLALPDKLEVARGATKYNMITVERIDDTTFKVTVEAAQVTTHRVTVSPSYYEKLTAGRTSVEALVEKSFEFLLERESNTSILSSFDLAIIGRYFPEYESSIKREFPP